MYPNCKLFPWTPPHTFPYIHSLPTRVPTLITRDIHLSTMWAQNTKTFFSLKMTRTSLRENLIFSLYDQIFKPSKLPAADFHLFKAGIELKWEDLECVVGGKWSVISSRKANLDTMWLETVKF